MPYADLREFLNRLETSGKLHRITNPVDKDWEIAAVSRIVFESISETQRPALLFERVKGFEIPVVAGVLGASRSIYCLALECELKDVPKKWGEAELRPIPPRRLSDGPVHENVLLGEKADLTFLPIPTWTVGKDPAPYITSGYIIAADQGPASAMWGLTGFSSRGRASWVSSSTISRAADSTLKRTISLVSQRRLPSSSAPIRPWVWYPSPVSLKIWMSWR